MPDEQLIVPGQVYRVNADSNFVLMDGFTASTDESLYTKPGDGLPPPPGGPHEIS